MDFFIYTRISSDRSGEGAGVQRQKAECLELAKANDLNVLEVFTDNDISAHSGVPRPAFNEMIRRLEAGEGDGIIVWHLDRLYRRNRDLELIVNIVESRKIEIKTVTAGEIDLNTSSGLLMARVIGSMANYEVDHQRERIKASHVDRAKRGTWRGGPIPLGFRSGGKGTLVIDEEEAKDVRFILDSILNGDSLHLISRRMNEPHRVKRRNGARWTNTAVRHLVKSPALGGLSKVSEGEYVPAQWEGIVPPEKWFAVQAILSDPARRTNQGTERRWQGSGVYLCGVCGKALRAKISNGVNYYSCIACHKVSRNQKKLDGLVDDLLIAYLSVPENRLPLVVKQESTTDLNELLSVQAGLIERRNQLGGLFAQGVISSGQLTRGNAEFEKQLKAIERKIDDARESSPVLEMLLSSDDLRERWGSMSADKRAEAIRRLVEVRVHSAGRGTKIFDPSKVEFTWK